MNETIALKTIQAGYPDATTEQIAEVLECISEDMSTDRVQLMCKVIIENG